MNNINISFSRTILGVIISCLLACPLTSIALSQEQVDSYHRDGYLIVRKLFNNDEVEDIRRNLEESYKLAYAKINSTEEVMNNQSESFRMDYFGPGGGSGSVKIQNKDNKKSIHLISWVGGMNPKLLKLGRDKRITASASQLLGSNEIDHLINQAHYKKPGDGIKFDWHQDLQHRRNFDPQWEDINGKGSFVQVITAIDRVTAENGPLVIVPNSHHLDLKLDSVSKEDRFAAVQRQYPDLDTASMVLEMEPGDTLFMHPLILHKSDVNYSNNSRIVFVNGFSYPGANKKPYPGKGSAQRISAI